MSPPFVTVLVAPPGLLPAVLVERVRAAVHGAVTWLSPGEAADIACAATDPATIAAAIQGALADRCIDAPVDAPVDAVIVPASGRRKRLLIADMDGTIVAGETLDDLAAIAGCGAQVTAITARSMNGVLEFADALRARVALLAGLDAAALERVPVVLDPGARTLVATMRAHGARTVLASGGFTHLIARAAALAGFDAHHGNILELRDGRLTGTVLEPVFDRAAKAALLRAEALAHGLPLAATLAVGDGANDLDMLAVAGLGVAYRAKPVVTAAVPAAIRHADLRALLFVQGFAAAEFVT